MIVQRATETQRQASNPNTSVWVSASAGSGKTKVLIDRVLSLMLSGAAPESILCLTFTKAAAAEMENRLYQRLAKWALQPQDKLASELETLLGRLVQQEDIILAKQLFSRAIDTPGGLKIQTIHAFCQAILKRFPLEAGLSPYFKVLDAPQAHEVLVEAQNLMMQETQIQDTLAHLGQILGSQVFVKLCYMILDSRAEFMALPDDIRSECEKNLQVDPFEDPTVLIQHFFDETPHGAVRSAIDVLSQGSKTDQGKAQSLLAWVDSQNPSIDINSYISCFLTQKGEPRKKLITNQLGRDYPQILSLLQSEIERVLTLNEKLRALWIAFNSYHLARFGKALVAAYEKRKQEVAALDYQDLILKTSHLLRDSSCSAWVLYKLDGGVDNILIDEAQDTSPEQWQVITTLCEEFFSQERDERTLFVVGDDKQSIYSFQGADPAIFSKMQRHFHERSQNIAKAWKAVELDISFRSTPVVLKAVDAIFHEDDVRQGVSRTTVQHHAFRSESPGHVELWPLVEPEAKDTSEVWSLPQVGRDQPPPSMRLAHLLAKKISHWIHTGKSVKGRPMTPGDIMILVRKRSAFVDQLIRALKKENVPVAGVDRMILLEQLAVQDLLKLVEFTLLPQDDLTLATVLKGPLFSMSEEDLFQLAHPRGELSLWNYMAQNTQHQSTVETLQRLIDQSKVKTPYQFFTHILGPLRGRELWQQRMGHEVLDPLDELLNLSLNFERDHTPSLQLFRRWIHEDQTELKRDLDQSDQVRVMTVHGSKGLQAPVVILPDTTQVPRQTPPLLWDEQMCLWMPTSDEDTPQTRKLREGYQKNQLEEYRRLLYVALTRAEDHLYICGWKTNPYTLSEGCWYDLARGGLASCADPHVFDFTTELGENGWGGEGYIVSASQKKVGLHTVSEPKAAKTQTEPQWLRTKLTPDPEPYSPLAPSRLCGEQLISALTPDPQGLGLKRGQLVHKLLEILPQLSSDKWEEGCRHYLQHQAIPEEIKAKITDDCLEILQTYPHLFTVQSQAEVPIVGLIGNFSLSGQIDRLVVSEAAVHIIDYKTNVTPPADLFKTPEAYLRQLAAYQAALEPLYPGREILCSLLWTTLSRLDTIPHDLLKPYLADPSANPLAA